MIADLVTVRLTPDTALSVLGRTLHGEANSWYLPAGSRPYWATIALERGRPVGVHVFAVRRGTLRSYVTVALRSGRGRSVHRRRTDILQIDNLA